MRKKILLKNEMGRRNSKNAGVRVSGLTLIGIDQLSFRVLHVAVIGLSKHVVERKKKRQNLIEPYVQCLSDKGNVTIGLRLQHKTQQMHKQTVDDDFHRNM